MGRPKNKESKFLKGIEPLPGCWNWRNLKSKGYGQFRINDSNVSAHRFSYEFFIGKIPFGMVIDHLCKNKKCINPSHLEVVTQRQNVMRGIGITSLNSKKKECKHGHTLSGKNLVIVKRLYGTTRGCRKCQTRLTREWRHRTRAKGSNKSKEN